MPTQADWKHESLAVGEMHKRLWLAVKMQSLLVIDHERQIGAL
jgi:hypothetical protein